MNRKEILAAAEHCVCGQREQDYGTPENSFKVTGELWEVYIKEKCVGTDTIVTIVPEDVAALLGLLKIARIATGHGKDDNWIDLAGYAACGGELQQNMGAAEVQLSQLACDHEWELSGADTGGLSYICKKCGAQQREPVGKRLDITTNSAETAGGCYE